MEISCAMIERAELELVGVRVVGEAVQEHDRIAAHSSRMFRRFWPRSPRS